MDTDTKQSNDAEVLERKLENANNSDERREIIAREISLTKSGPLPDPEDFKNMKKFYQVQLTGLWKWLKRTSSIE